VKRYLDSLCFIPLLVWSAAGCDSKIDSDGRTADVATTQDIQSIQKSLGVHFPNGSRLIGSHREDGMDDYLGAKVEMPRTALTAFLESCPIPKDRYADGEGGLLGSDSGFWDPNKQPKLRTGQAQLPGARALNIGYDDSRPDVAVVFVVNHGT
jgi:hypothetical protein